MVLERYANIPKEFFNMLQKHYTIFSRNAASHKWRGVFHGELKLYLGRNFKWEGFLYEFSGVGEKALLTSSSAKWVNCWDQAIIDSTFRRKIIKWELTEWDWEQFLRVVRLELAQLLPSGDHNTEFLSFYDKTFALGKGWTLQAWDQGKVKQTESSCS